MRRRYYSDDDSLGQIIYLVSVLYFLYLLLEYFTNRANFWRWLFYGLAVVVILIGGIRGWRTLMSREKTRRLEELMKGIRDAGLEDYVKNFINRFGFEGKRGKGWEYRSHIFEWERIDDLEKILLEKEINLRHDEKQRDIFNILRYYIQEKEEKLTRESIHREPQKFASLTGTEFEKLLYRLFEAMGYSVEWIGKTGDQGGDLIANKEGERILIQAKCYRDWSTGNEAVQQVVGAMKYYDCNKTMVITTSGNFTPEAITLAKSNSTDLVSKKRLQELLLRYLKESWS